MGGAAIRLEREELDARGRAQAPGGQNPRPDQLVGRKRAERPEGLGVADL
jgi:hypothetical protein